jgi:FKBP-type peptidyl-prolyl cis-trans isomerase 2
MSEKEEKKARKTPVKKTKKAPSKKAVEKKAPSKRKKAEAAPEAPKAEVKEVIPAADRPVGKGDFVLVEMTGKVEETGELFETTSEEVAKTSGVHKEGDVYGPRLIVVGEGWVLKGLDVRLEGLKVGEESKIQIPPADAFGERDPENVNVVPYRILRSKGVNPSLGAQVEFDGRSATIRSIGAGRVQLDYNPPLAGRKIDYTVKVEKRFETEEEKLKALIARRFQGTDAEKFAIKLSKKGVRIEEPEDIFFSENLQLAKRALALDIQRFFPSIAEVEFAEIVTRKA